MSKQSGLGDRLYVGGYDLSGDVGALNRISGSVAPISVTGINKSAPERIFGRRDGGIDYLAYFNDAANAAHVVLSALPRTDVIVQYGRGASLGSPAAGCVAKQIDYPGARAEAGDFTFPVVSQGNGFALEWGVQLTAGTRTDTGATSGTAVDFGAGSAFGASAYIQILGFTGVDATILIQASSDNGVGDAFAEPSGGFAHTVTGARTAVRIRTSSAIERYVRVATVTTGGFSSLAFAVMVNVNEAASVL